MKQKSTFLKVFMTLLLLMGVSSVWAESKIATFTAWTYSSNKIQGGSLSNAPTGATASLSTTYTNANQMTKDKTHTLTISGFDGCTITGVTVHVKTNASSGGGTGTLTINGVEKGTLPATGVIGGSYINKYFTVTPTTVDAFGTIVIVLKASSNSLYCDKYEITYNDDPVRTLESITISGTPDKTTYVEGETFDPKGLVVTGTYDNDDEEEITSGIEWTCTPSALSLGTNSVSVVATVGTISSDAYDVDVAVSEKPVLPSYTLVTDASELMDGDIIVLGAEKGDSWYANAGINGKFLDSTDATCNDDILESEGAVGITLIAVDDGWNLKIGDKYINTTVAKALTFADDASTVWTISINEDGATVAAGEFGRFLYNATSPRFLNYANSTATNVSMLLPQIFKKKVTQTQTVTITDAGWASMYLDYAVEIPEGVSVYYAKKATTSTITLSPVEGYIPANCGVVVKGSGNVTFKETAKTVATIEGNLFLGGVKPVTVEASSTYVLSSASTPDAPVFGTFTGTEIPANKAYLEKPVNGNNTVDFTFDDATAIDEVAAEAKSNSVRVNLAGQIVGRDYKGIVIVNGKKMFNK